MRKNIVSPSGGNAARPEERLSTGLVESGTLSNGLRIVSNQVPWIHSVTLGLWIDAGSREDPEGLEGMAHFIEHALFKGTQKRDYVEIARCIEQTGGYIDAWTTKEQTCLCVRCLREHLHLAFDLLADLCCNPVFPPDEIEKEKEVVLEEIAGVNDTPEELIFEDFDRRTFPGHPLGTPILGTEKSVEKLSVEEIRNFMRRHYTPSKMLLTAIGNIGHDEVAELADSFLGHLKDAPREDSARRLFDLSTYKPFSKTLKKSVFQSQILLGAITPRDDRRFWAMMVLNAMLSSGMSSILNLELRERHGLVYQAYSSVSFYDEVTTFNVYAGTDKGKTQKTLDTIGELLTGDVLKKPDPSELAAAKSKMLGSMILGMEKMTRRMSHIAQDIFYFGRYLSPAEKAGMIDGVTAEEVALVAAALGIPERLSTLVYKPGGR